LCGDNHFFKSIKNGYLSESVCFCVQWGVGFYTDLLAWYKVKVVGYRVKGIGNSVQPET
jgi:hypothetical protein